MNPVRMLINNEWDIATPTVTTGTEVSTLPIEHSQVYGRSKTAAITPDETGESVIEFDLPALTLASGLVLYRHWLSNLAEWRLELFNEAGLAGDLVFDSDFVECTPTKTLGELDWLVDTLVASVFDKWPHKYSQLWFDGVFFQSGRLTIRDTEAHDGLHEFDRIYLGRVFSPTFNFSYGHSHQWLSNAQQRNTAAGSSFAVSRERFRQITFSLDYILDVERPHLSEAIRDVGIAKDWFISMFPETGGKREIEYAMSCKFTANPVLSGTFFNNFTAPFSIKEA
jgi:hypothetical protein